MIVAASLIGLGLSVQDHRVVTPLRPIGEPRNWVTYDDYPPDALWERRGGDISFVLDIGTDGIPAKCTLTLSSGSPVLDKATCDLLMRRARFRPALDAQGSPTPSPFRSRFHWEISPDVEVPLRSWVTTTQVQLSGDGIVQGCFRQSSGANFVRGTDPCTLLGRRVPEGMRALLGTSGAPATVTVIETHVARGVPLAPFDPPPGKPIYSRTIRFDIDAKGEATGCKASGAAGPDPLRYIAYRCHPGYRYPAGTVGRGAEATVTMYLARQPAPPRPYNPAEGPII